MKEVIDLLQRSGHKCFTNNPGIKINPNNYRLMDRECKEIVKLLLKHGYEGFIVKQCKSYKDTSNPWHPYWTNFIEIEIWK